MVQPIEKIIHKSNSTERLKTILKHELELKWIKRLQTPFPVGFNDDDDDDDEFRFNDASTHEGHLRQNGELTWFCNETIILISHKCIKCKTRTNLKIKAVILC